VAHVGACMPKMAIYRLCISTSFKRTTPLRQGMPVRSSLDIWPTLPIVISYSFLQCLDVGSQDNIHAALGRKDRVCQISLEGISRYRLEGFLDEMWEPFPELSHLDLRCYGNGNSSLTIPDSFLGGSAPRLQEFHLYGFRFPALREFLCVC
jgi:hypothetical protein